MCWDEIFWCDWYFKSWLEHGGVKSKQIHKKEGGGTRLVGSLFMERSCPWMWRWQWRGGSITGKAEPLPCSSRHTAAVPQSWRWTFNWVADSVLTHSMVPKSRYSYFFSLLQILSEVCVQKKESFLVNQFIPCCEIEALKTQWSIEATFYLVNNVSSNSVHAYTQTHTYPHTHTIPNNNELIKTQITVFTTHNAEKMLTLLLTLETLEKRK